MFLIDFGLTKTSDFSGRPHFWRENCVNELIAPLRKKEKAHGRYITTNSHSHKSPDMIDFCNLSLYSKILR